jgi:EmrB/QacA subfamily drug resistance transporter
VLFVTILGSGMAFLDATVVNIALPAIGEDFGASLSDLQWTANAYTLTLSGLLLLGGALGDRLGRRRVFFWGVVWFTVASLVCAAAPNVQILIAARALQGIGAAALTPGSLAIIEASFARDDRAEAIGAWSGLSGAVGAVGPLLGGWLIGAASWRLVFLINLPLGALTARVAARHLPETRDPKAGDHPLDLLGVALAAIGLAGVVFALTDGPAHGWGTASILIGLAGVVALAALVLVELDRTDPLMPLDLFATRQFSVANVLTFIVYAALAGPLLFLFPLQLQVSLGYSPIEAGAALIPLTVLTLLLSARAGRLDQRIGPRVPLTAGTLLASGGLALLADVAPGSGYVPGVLPGVVLVGLGVALAGAPLTATVMGAAGEERAGVASALNNTVARVAGLLAVALLPIVTGLTGDAYRDPAQLTDAYESVMWLAAALCAAGGLLAAALMRPRPPAGPTPELCCPLEAPPLRRRGATTAKASGLGASRLSRVRALRAFMLGQSPERREPTTLTQGSDR